MVSLRRFLGAALGVLAIACAHAPLPRTANAAPAHKPLHIFPSRASLTALADKTQPPLATNVIELESWPLELPALPPDSAVHALLPLLAPGAAATPALDCVAHELGRILLRTPNKQPSIALRRFISARCGALVAMPGFQTWSLPGGHAVSDKTLVAELRGKLANAAASGAGTTAVGAAVVRDDRDVIVVAAFAKPQVHVEAFSAVVADNGQLNVRGELLFESDGVVAYVNTGQTGYERCTLDQTLAPPAFGFSCQLAPGDDFAWVQLMALPRGRVISPEVLNVIALRRPDAALVYHPRRLGERRPIETSSQFTTSVLEALNQLRAQAGLRTLTASAPQSQLANQVTPSLFTALMSEDQALEPQVDRIVLGLLAGWDVSGGTIRDANIAMNLSVDALDASRWLSDTLELPAGRVVLLDPHVDALAIGATVQQQPAAIAAVALTYAFFQDERVVGERARRVFERLERVRTARKLGVTRLIAGAHGMPEQLARVHSGEVAPSAALDVVMRAVVQSERRSVHGLIWETQDLDALEFPEELLRPGDLAIAVGVTYHRAPQGAWGQYSVLFVVVALASTLHV